MNEPEQQPSGDLVPVEQLAQFLDLTPRRVQQLARDGIIPKTNRRGGYPLRSSVRDYIRHLRESGRRAGEGGETLTEVQTEHERIKVRERTLRVDQLAGTLIDRRAAERRFAELITQASNLLEQFPADVAPDLAAKYGIDVAELETDLETALRLRLGKMTAQAIAQVDAEEAAL